MRRRRQQRQRGTHLGGGGGRPAAPQMPDGRIDRADGRLAAPGSRPCVPVWGMRGEDGCGRAAPCSWRPGSTCSARWLAGELRTCRTGEHDIGAGRPAKHSTARRRWAGRRSAQQAPPQQVPEPARRRAARAGRPHRASIKPSNTWRCPGPDQSDVAASNPTACTVWAGRRWQGVARAPTGHGVARGRTVDAEGGRGK